MYTPIILDPGIPSWNRVWDGVNTRSTFLFSPYSFMNSGRTVPIVEVVNMSNIVFAFALPLNTFLALRLLSTDAKIDANELKKLSSMMN